MLFHSFTQRIGADGPCFSSREMIEPPIAILRNKANAPYSTARSLSPAMTRYRAAPTVAVFNQYPSAGSVPSSGRLGTA